MHRSLSKLALAAALSAATAAAAAAQGPQLSLGGGATLPTGEVGDSHHAGWHGQVSMGYRPPMFPLGFRIDGMYHDLEPASLQGGGGGAGDLRTISVSGNVVLEAPALAVRPYLIGGAGLYNTRIAGSASRNTLGVNGGAGLRFHLMDFESFVEARFHAALDAVGPEGDRKAAQFVPITFGISF